tara:strand:- start:238 stop:405 length:168 start_codon:yes stop_codon:yes gene_type:complete
VLGECAADPYSFDWPRSLLDTFFVESFVCIDEVEIVQVIIYLGGVYEGFPDYWRE